jgi:phosphatidylglycerophosphate synthase
MFDSKLRPFIDPPLNKIGRWINRYNISANKITTGGLLLCIPLFTALLVQSYIIALIFLLMNRLLDGLDGPTARQSKKGATDFGGYLDIISDFIFYSGFVFFFAVGAPYFSLSAAFLLFSFFLSGISFLTYAIMAEKRKMSTDIQGDKSLYYMVGLAEGAETIAAFILICLFPAAFTIIAIVFGIMCWITAIGRTISAYQNFQ